MRLSTAYLAGYTRFERDPEDTRERSPTSGNATVPVTLQPFTPLTANQARRTRVFTLAMSGMVHTINGQLFNLRRTDFSVPFGYVENWEYRNTGTEPHPIHMHAARCQVLSRSSAASLVPEDTGRMDTVLVNPGETVGVLTRFDTYSGVFVHHCHNLEHEDLGMMQNFEVLPPPVGGAAFLPVGQALSLVERSACLSMPTRPRWVATLLTPLPLITLTATQAHSPLEKTSTPGSADGGAG